MIAIAQRFGACAALAALILLAGCRPSDKSWYGPEDQYALNVGLSTNSINVGSLVELEVDILHPADAEPVFTDPGDDDKIIVRERSWDSVELDDGREISSIRYLLTSFKLGEHKLLDGDVKFIRGEQQVDALEFEKVLLSVESMLAGSDAEMRDIAPGMDFPRRFPRWLPVLLLIAALAALAGAVAARLYRRRAPKAAVVRRPPADEIALRDLEALRGRGWIEEGLAEPFYVELSRIVRSYIEDRFGLRAPEQTTEEFIREAAQSDKLSLDHRQLTSEFLNQSDMVKFARYQPGRGPMEQAFGSAERLVRETAAETGNPEGGESI